MSQVEWGEYKLGDLFEIKSSKKIYHANKISKIYEDKVENSFPYVVRSTQNNGMRGYIMEDEKFANEGNTLSFAQDTFSVFYQKEKFFTGNKVKILKPLFKEKNSNIMHFFVACFQKALSSFSWGVGSTVETIKSTKINLPTKNGEIDFKFINSYIAELEALRIAELEAYLLATGLKDYTLTPPEKSAIENLEKTEFKEYNIPDIFEFKNTCNILSSDIVKDSGTVPYLCASAENNAVNSYITYDKKYLEKGNCIFIGGKTFVVSYQKKDFYSNDSHNLALYLRNTEKTKKKQLYLVTCIYKSLKHKYSWGNSISKAKIKTEKVFLPTVNGQVDFDSMEMLISAIQKLVIKDVVLYADRKISATKTVVSAKN